jgi:nucleotide-binding universal stress UspA family protein
MQAGLPADAVSSKFKPKYYDVAEDLINEAHTGGFGTIVMGRRGLGKAESLLLGSVTNKVVQNARACAVTVAE